MFMSDNINFVWLNGMNWDGFVETNINILLKAKRLFNTCR